MEQLLWTGRFLIRWVVDNPLGAVGFVLVYALARWALNRRSPLMVESDRIVARLQEEAKGKYRDLRPLR